jgi:hypothetical protein
MTDYALPSGTNACSGTVTGLGLWRIRHRVRCALVELGVDEAALSYGLRRAEIIHRQDNGWPDVAIIGYGTRSGVMHHQARHLREHMGPMAPAIGPMARRLARHIERDIEAGVEAGCDMSDDIALLAEWEALEARISG